MVFDREERERGERDGCLERERWVSFSDVRSHHGGGGVGGSGMVVVGMMRCWCGGLEVFQRRERESAEEYDEDELLHLMCVY